MVPEAMKLSLILGFLLAIPAFAGKSTHEPAENLVRAMKVEELVARLVERDVRWRCEIEKCEIDLKVCLATMDRAFIEYWLVGIAERELTTAEMEAATAYFRSDTGMRHIEVIRATLGIGKASLNDEKPEIRAAMLAFLDTPAGYRLVTRAVLTNTDAVNSIIRWQSREVLGKCRPTE